MVFRTEPNIQRAREHLDSNDGSRLRYACLELRLALESIAYQKLQLRLDKITIEEIGAWQPKRVMERLMELVDEHLTEDSVLRVAPEGPDGKADDADFVTLGSNKGINPKDIGKHWFKLSSFLHTKVPKKKGDIQKPLNEAELRKYIEEVISYIEDVTSSQFDSHFSENVTFKCNKCSQSIVRNSNLVKYGDIVQFQNPNCNTSYIANIQNGNFTFKNYKLHFDCRECKQRNYIEANDLLNLEKHKLQSVTCVNCETQYHVRWALELIKDEKIGEM